MHGGVSPAGRGFGAIRVNMPASKCTPAIVAQLKDALSTHPGTTEVHLKLINGQRNTSLKLDDALRLTPTPALMGDLKALLGPSCLT
jgi:DNA polymerase-3 subunit alpha